MTLLMLPLVIRLFADDTCLVFNNSSLSILELNCNIELKNLKNWCDANKLQINPQKSAVIVIPPKLNSPSVNIQLMYNNSLYHVITHLNTLA